MGCFDPFRYCSLVHKGCFSSENQYFPFVYVLLHRARRKYHKIEVETFRVAMNVCFVFYHKVFNITEKSWMMTS